MRSRGAAAPKARLSFRAQGAGQPLARFHAVTEENRRQRRGVILAADHPAVVQGGTLFPTRLRWPGLDGMLLKSGRHQRKIGDRIIKGAWKGFPVYTLTLQERTTCPNDCAQYRNCMGNKMPHSRRLIHGKALEWRLEIELSVLQDKHPGGFAVRLHILGDFYSVEYLGLWERWLKLFPALHVWGYTAWQASTPIGAAVAALRDRLWERFAVRTSNARSGPRTVVIPHRPSGPVTDEGAIICPAETGQSANCGSCGLCWHTKKPIAFIQH